MPTIELLILLAIDRYILIVILMVQPLPLLCSSVFKNTYLLICLAVLGLSCDLLDCLVVALKLLATACVGSSSLPRDRTRPPALGAWSHSP